MAVAIDVVDTIDRAPVLVPPQGGHRETAFGAALWTLPFFVREVGRGMRRMAQRIVVMIHPALLDGADLGTNGNHRVAEAVEFSFRFRFRRLDH